MERAAVINGLLGGLSYILGFGFINFIVLLIFYTIFKQLGTLGLILFVFITIGWYSPLFITGSSLPISGTEYIISFGTYVIANIAMVLIFIYYFYKNIYPAATSNASNSAQTGGRRR
jgi:hypothetical protein